MVLGLLGQNGIGKTTTLRILSGEVKLNLGNYENPPDWDEIVQHFRGSTLQDYFLKMGEGKLTVSHKPQYVDKIPKVVSGNVGELLAKVDERNSLKKIAEQLDLKQIWDRPLEV